MKNERIGMPLAGFPERAEGLYGGVHHVHEARGCREEVNERLRRTRQRVPRGGRLPSTRSRRIETSPPQRDPGPLSGLASSHSSPDSPIREYAALVRGNLFVQPDYRGSVPRAAWVGRDVRCLESRRVT